MLTSLNTTKLVPSFAVIKGAKVIEKHFTTDNNLPGRDNKFSILPEQLKELNDYIEMKRQMNTDCGDGYLKCEQEARDIMTGRFNG